MYYALARLFFALLFLNAVSVYGSLYVINPLSGSTCHGSQPCTVDWLDDGTEPLLSSIGACTVGLYTGQEKLVQTITPVDVSSTHSLQFTPDPKAGPNSNTYYIAFTSTTLKAQNGSGYFQAFSPNFSLDKMTGSFASPVPSDTATQPIPSTVAYPPNNPVTSTSIVGQLSTSGFSTATTSMPTTMASPSLVGASSTSNSVRSAASVSSLLYYLTFLFSAGFVVPAALGYL